MKLDLHNHTVFSPDSASTVEDTITHALRAGMDGIAVTDHNTVRGSLEALKSADGRLLVIPGSEVSTSEGHILCLGIREDVTRGLSMRETVERVHSLGGIAVPSHPFRLGTGAGGVVLRRLDLEAIETMNGRNLRSGNRKAEAFAGAAALGSTGGSDSHEPMEVGRAYTVVSGSGLTEEEVLDAIRHRETRGAGTGQTLGGSARTMYKIITEYFSRGRKHI